MAQNYFELFGLTPNYEIDLVQLNEKQHAMQRQFHPDKFQFEHEKRQAQKISANLNEAYETLRSPLKRACYLLRLNDIALDENDTQFPADFLMAQMDLREQLSECRADKEALMLFMKAVEAKFNEQIVVIGRLFQQLPDSTDALTLRVRELFFYDKLKTETEQSLWQF